MIKGIILDVDGVLVGSKKGYNWPDPHLDVIKTLKSLRSKGIIISLCTGKGAFAIKNIVESAHLNNLHIGDGGAVVIDFLDNIIIDKYTIENKTALEVIETYLNNNTYLEVYTIDGYYVQKNQASDITKKHTDILYRDPILVDSLLDESKRLEIIKIMPIAKDERDKKSLIELFNPFKEVLSLQWGTHLTALPLQMGIITAKNISKKYGAMTISRYAKIPFENMLGVGDGMTDWNFMQLCEYVGVMGNASEELKKAAHTKKNYFIGPGVNENGILSIFEHFRVL